jgi:hypothetical protein
MSTDTNLNQLQQIKKITTVVADTADFESIRVFTPQDATTNPSLVYAATQKENYSHFLDEVLTDRRKSGLSGAAQLEDIIDHLLVRFLAGKLVRLRRFGTGRRELAILSGRRININIHLLPDTDGKIQTQIPASTVAGAHRRETKGKG